MVRFLVASLMTVVLALPACTGQRLPAPPESVAAELPPVRGFREPTEIRFWGDLAPASAADQLAEIRRQIAARIAAEGVLPNEGKYDVLALSGGGSDGAYGAGLLNGWSDRGDRPEFGLVTGISVGALIAPFAFLGVEYDDDLERLFTRTATGDIVQFNIFRAVFGWTLGVTDIAPLELTFDRVMTSDMVRRIAEEHAKGRRLWIGTTHLDAQRPVIWDIGAIANSAYPDKRELIKRIMLASAAIPGAFPPVLIPVEANGELYSEMHVDGAVTRQLFVYPGNVDLRQQADGSVSGMRLGTIYLVRNTKLAADYQPVDPSLLRIVGRSIFTLIKAAGLGDVEIIEQQARRDGWGLLRTSVPVEFDFPEDAFFDPQYMSALYDVGYDRAARGIAWEIVVEPGGEPAETAPEPDLIAADG